MKRFYAKAKAVLKDIKSFEIGPVKETMEKVVASQKLQMDSISVGKPSVNFLTSLKVKTDKSWTPITSLAQFASKDSQNVSVFVLDAKYSKDIQTTINTAELGVICQPESSTSINVPVPK